MMKYIGGIYEDLRRLPCGFLRNILRELSKEYKFKRVFVDKKGELGITFEGKLPIEDIKDILQRITPGEVLSEEDDISSYFIYLPEEPSELSTIINSKEGIDYRTL